MPIILGDVQEYNNQLKIRLNQWLILSQSFHKWRNILKFLKEFIFGIIQRINMQISIFCHFCHQKREFDIILMYNMWMICFKTDTIQIPKSKKYNHMLSCVVHQNYIKFCFVMTKVTKYWNFHVDTFNNIKYKFLWKLHHVSSLLEKLRQN